MKIGLVSLLKSKQEVKGKVRREEGRMTSATRVGIVVSMEDQTPNNLFMRMNLGRKHAKRIASKQ